jgi:uncharacterized protein
MLISFTAENFRSICDPVTLSMEATGLTGHEENNIIETDKNNRNLLKSAVIYGANASGKSNIIKAFSFMRFLVLTSAKESGGIDKIKTEPFLLDSESGNKPLFFEAVFIYNDVKYRYGFEVTSDKIYSEWLFHKPGLREIKLFTREEDKLDISNSFNEGKTWKELVEKSSLKLRENALFVSLLTQIFGESPNFISRNILNWFNGIGIIDGVNDLHLMPFSIFAYHEKRFGDRMLELIKAADFNIENVETELKETSAEEDKAKAKNFNLAVKSIHRKYTGNNNDKIMFDFMTAESEGTKKFFGLTGPLLDILDNGKLLVIDEFDARMHPLLTRKIIELFNSPANTNNAQLICVTHNTNMLDKDLIRRDQIWFTEKNHEEKTRLYSLAEFKKNGKGVRASASIEKNYIQGRYGAIPYLGDFENLWNDEGTDNGKK